jgi:cell wall-associated NlpC family hydrolase
MARSIWPEGRLPDERLDWFCQRFAQSALTNHTLVYFDVSAQREADVVALHGCTNAPPVAVGLRHALRTVGIPNTRNEVRPLPNRDRLGEHLFGVCRASTALTYSQPSPGSGLQTQLLFGEPLFLLDRDDEYYLLHAGDGYWGWVPQAAVQAMTAEQFDAYLRHPQAAVLEDIEGPQVRIPRGASLPLVQTTDTERTLLLPDGSTLGAPAAATALGNTAQQQAAARVRAGLDLLYVPYVFGGRSPLGLDCSGLMSNVYARAGDRPPRDAWQQALAGRLVATAWHRAGIQGGDQLFFINETGKIYHTGIALDAVHVLHSAPPCVQIGSLDPQDPLYDLELNRNFLLAKRP